MTKIRIHEIGGIGSGITCIHQIIFYLKYDHNEVLPVRMFYSAQTTETVILPTDIFSYNVSAYGSWTQISHVKRGVGCLQVYSESGINSIKVKLQMRNKLWYFTDQCHKSSHHVAVVREDNIIQYAKIQRTKDI